MPVVKNSQDLDMHLTDLNALIHHFEEVVEKQLDYSRRNGSVEGIELTTKVHSLLSRHKELIRRFAESRSSSLKVSSKETFSKFLGAVAGLYDKGRSYPESRAMRDNYTALSLLSASLTLLKTYGLQIGDTAVSKMAYDMLSEVCPLIIEISRTLPVIVCRETAKEEEVAYDQAVVDRVTNAVARCWSH
ncbi:MAG TPA: hypothetical protein EYO33_17615 [Phycisphaerales bacterium]|nr:hypothetical protein [Phycisphaerales bacterium]